MGDMNAVYTADILVFNEKAELLLVKRGSEPFAGQWALPGGWVESDERAEGAAVRELKEETGIELTTDEIGFATVSDAPNRDPRGRVVSAVFVANRPVGTDVVPVGGDDAAEAKFWPLAKLPALAFDHDEIVELVAGDFARDMVMRNVVALMTGL